jgi:hypothetical protein
MIGVSADFAQQEVIREFFELFKTPWEFYRRGRRYEVLLCTGHGEFEDDTADVILVYAGRRTYIDPLYQIQTGSQRRHACIVSNGETRIPIYGESITFPENREGILVDENSRQCVAHLKRSGNRVLARVGYDLFGETYRLLTEGQPAANAGMPALDLHIAFLRNLITGCGVILAEIPPLPDGYRFIACLTHDVDHPSIRKHQWDHTTFGFWFRAVFGSLCNLIASRLSVRGLMTNWTAALKLPFVQLGLAKDFWEDFGDRYLELEKGVHSTFFVIPFKNRSGTSSDGPAPRFRAARYGARDIGATLQTLLTAGCEVGLHGIDAWTDSMKGREELEEIRRLSGVSAVGVRMHWLYYDQRSPMVLENAGAAYDSTVGYNETVGYRAGTTQGYKPFGASRLFELPLHVMDTALFYSAYLGLSPGQARILLRQLVDNTIQFGGCLTINWHDRSLSPERLWRTCYRDLVQELKRQGAWFATAGQATSWFRKRRAVVFEIDGLEPDGVRARVAAGSGDNLPGLRLRIHKMRQSRGTGAYRTEDYVDMAFQESIDVPVACDVSE